MEWNASTAMMDVVISGAFVSLVPVLVFPVDKLGRAN